MSRITKGYKSPQGQKSMLDYVRRRDQTTQGMSPQNTVGSPQPGTSRNGQGTSPAAERSNNQTQRSTRPSPRKRLRFSDDSNPSNGNEDSSQSLAPSDSDDSVAPPNTDDSVMPIAVHKIIAEKFYKARLRRRSGPDQDGGTLDEEAIIKKIIDGYNDSHTSRSQDDDLDGVVENTGFREMEGGKQIVLSPSAKSLMVGKEFQVKLYVKETFSQNYILRWHESELRNCNIHIIWFFYRPKEIFALTTNQAWNVVQKYADFLFPMRVAARLCTPEGPKKTADKVLVGHVLKSSKVTQIGKGSHVDEVPVICTSFNAELREGDASILKFPCFQAERENKVRTSIQFGFSSVRFQRRFKVEDLPLILDHLSLIAHKQKTTRFDKNIFFEESELPPMVFHTDDDDHGVHNAPTHPITNADAPETGDYEEVYSFSQDTDDMAWEPSPQDEIDAPIYRRNLVKVSSELSSELDGVLLSAILEKIRRPVTSSFMGCLNFCPPHPSQVLHIFHNKEKLDDLPFRFNLNTVLKILKEKLKIREDTPMKNDISQNFKVQYDHEKHKTNWLKYVEAEIIHDGRTFWRVSGIWCTIHPAYIFSAHTWFPKFLRDSLITREDELCLPFLWQRVDESREDGPATPNTIYIRKYENKEVNGYLLPPDKYKTKNLFDILHVYAGEDGYEIRIYYISSNLHTQTSEISLRIFRCMEEIMLALKTNPSGYFQELRESDLLLREVSPKEYKKILSTIRFIYALCSVPPHVPTPSAQDIRKFFPTATANTNHLPSPPSLAKEKDLPMDITQTSIQRLLKPSDCPLTHDDMKNLLRSEGEKPRSGNNVIPDTTKFLHKRLERECYIQNNKPTLKFLFSNKYNFSLGFKEENQKYNTQIFELISGFQTQYSCLRAKLELRNLATTSFLDTKFCIEELEMEE